jgi:O-antigen/teichoic acid export membrane protein
LGAEAFWVLGGQIGVAVGGLFGIKVLTHLLSPYEFGKLSIANTIVLLIGINLFGPMGQGLLRFWSIAQDRQDVRDYTRLSKKYIQTLSIIVVFLALSLSLALRFFNFREWAFLLGPSLVVGAFSGWGGIRLSTLMAARRRKSAAIINAATSFAKPTIAALLMVFISGYAELAIFGFLIVTFVSSCATEMIYKQTVASRLKDVSARNKEKSSGNMGYEILKFSYPFFLWAIFGWIHQSCDRWSLVIFYDPDVVGAFSVIAQLSVYPIVFGSNFLNTFFLPIAYQRAGQLNSKSAVDNANKILFAMMGFFILGTAILIIVFHAYHRPIVLLASNAGYVKYSSLLPALTCVWSLYYLGQLLTSFGLLAKKPREYITPIVSSGMLALVLTFYLSRLHGPIGVVWGLGISGIIYSTWCLTIARKLIKYK